MSGEPAPPSSADVVYGILSAVVRQRLLIAIPLLLLPPVGFFLGKRAPRTYETHMSVLVQDAAAKSSAIADPGLPNLKERLSTIKALLASRPLLTKVAVDSGLLPRDAPREAQDWVIAKLAAGITLELTGDDLIELSYRAPSPDGIDHVLARVERAVVEEITGPARKESSESVAFFKESLAKASANLDAAEADLTSFRASHLQELPDQRTAMITRLGAFREELRLREIVLAGARGQLRGITGQLVQTDPVIGGIEQEIASVTAEILNLRSKYTDRHSSVISAEERLNRLQRELQTRIETNKAAPVVDADRLWNMVANLKGGGKDGNSLLASQVGVLEQAKARVQQIEDEEASIRSSIVDGEHRLAASGNIEKTLQERERAYQSLKEDVADLRARYARAKVQDDFARYQAPQRFQVVDQPVEPLHPVKSPTTIYTLAGIVAGIALGGGLAFGLEYLDPTVRRRRDAERLTGLPMLARIPASA